MDEKEFSDIFNETYHAVYRTAYNILKNLDLAQDVCQDTYLKFLKNPKVCQGYGCAEWLLLESHYHAIDYCKKAYRKHERSALTMEILENGDQRNSLGHHENSIEEMIINRQLTEKILKVLKKENPVGCELLIRTYIIQEKDAEIAEALGITLSNVRTKRHRLLGQLRAKYASELR